MRICLSLALIVLSTSVGTFAANVTAISQVRQIIENPDGSKTYISPMVKMLNEEGESANESAMGPFGIGKGLVGACQLVGMHNYLSDYVNWSKELMQTVALENDGSIAAVSTGFYIESMTCVSDSPSVGKITATNIQHHADGSVMVESPLLHHGPRTFPINSGHEGACFLLGFGEPIKYSLSWSMERGESVSLDRKGNIYTKAVGTFVTSMSCRSN